MSLVVACVVVACDRSSPELPPPTSTPPQIERSTGAGIASIGGIQARQTEVRGVVADLLMARREAGLLTVTIRFRNTSADSVRFDFPSVASPDLRLRLTAGEDEWPIARDGRGELMVSGDLSRTLGPAQSVLWQGRFQAPPWTVTSLDLEMPLVVGPFRDIPIADAR